MKRLQFISALLLVISLAAFAHAATPQLCVEEVKTLVLEAIPQKTKSLPKFGLESSRDANSPRFYLVTAMWAGAPGGSAVIDSYYVDSSTGDVWNAVVECDEIRSSRLLKLQEKFRSRIGLSDAEYRKIKTKGPLCE